MDLTETMTEGNDRAGRPRPFPLLSGGHQLGRFRIDRIIGAGGYGAVYEAFDTELQRSVALKVLRAPSGEQERALLREARALARVDHPHLVRVIDVSTIDEQIVMAMELVEGTSFSEWVRSQQPHWTKIVDAVAAVADALAAAHGAGLIHRDIKPANIMMTPDGLPVVVDFGLAVQAGLPTGPSEDGAHEPALPQAQQTRTAGTPRYMAPEQMAGGRIDARADEYALALVLYEALTGVLPFDGQTPAVLYDEKQRVTKVTLSSAMPVALARIIERALAPRPTNRYAHLSEFREQLRGIVLREDRERRMVRIVGVAALSFGVPSALVIIFGSTPTTGWVALAALVVGYALANLSRWLGRRGVSGVVRGGLSAALVNTFPYGVMLANDVDIGPEFAFLSWSAPLAFAGIIMISTVLRVPWLPIALSLQAALLIYLFVWGTDYVPQVGSDNGASAQFFRALQLVSLGFIAGGAAWLLPDQQASPGAVRRRIEGSTSGPLSSPSGPR